MDQKVYEYVKTIPEGKVATYASVAKAVGSPRAYRAVGTILSKNPYPFDSCNDASMIPCHRVVKSDGKIGGFFGSEENSRKIELLEAEGVKIINGKINLSDYLFI
jgi:O-6-methylguanine DNA methyltransferase